jgi:hypothetical protein
LISLQFKARNYYEGVIMKSQNIDLNEEVMLNELDEIFEILIQYGIQLNIEQFLKDNQDESLTYEQHC